MLQICLSFTYFCIVFIPCLVFGICRRSTRAVPCVRYDTILLDDFVRNKELNEIISDHLEFDFNLVEGLTQFSRVKFQSSNGPFLFCRAFYPRLCVFW